MSADLSGFSLWDLFRGEVETHAATLNAGLLALEQAPGDLDRIKEMMRAAHSIKGAARVVRHDAAVTVAHAMEDRLVAAQQGRLPVDADVVQRLLDGVDLLVRLSPESEGGRDAAVAAARADVDRLVSELSAVSPAQPAPASPAPVRPAPPPEDAPPRAATAPAPPAGASGETTLPPAGPPVAPPPAAPTGPAAGAAAPDRSIRLTAQTVTRMVGLAGEAMVGLRWLEPFSGELEVLKRRAAEATAATEQVVARLAQSGGDDETLAAVRGVADRLDRLRHDLIDRSTALEGFLLRQEGLSSRLYAEVIATRMRPFGEVAEGYPRLVRDLARSLGKQVRLQIEGKATPVDRDVAGILDAPLVHAIRNALDHGIEPPEERVRAGKPGTGTLRLAASHRAGMLRVEIGDDGRGVDVERVRALVVERGFADAAMAARLAERELLDFLFLPGFSTASAVTEVSGRGVGLDVVHEALKLLGGRFDLTNRPGRGFTVGFDLPLTLSVLRVLVAEIGGEPYAFPLTRVERVVVVPAADVRTVEGRQYITLTMQDAASAGAGGPPPEQVRHVGIAPAAQVLGLEAAPVGHAVVSLVVLRDRDALYGLAVDRLVGEATVAVRPLDPRLGKVKDVSAAALSTDGTPLLVLDPDDLVRSIDLVLTGGRLAAVDVSAGGVAASASRRRVLVVDDSITVREVERQLLESRGYAVDTAVDGMDGWNAVRTGHYDLVVSDVDMPRMDGIEMLRRIRGDRRLAQLPVIVVSYKDREEDRVRGLDAGASYYLAKASFQDETFLRAVDELIGPAEDEA